MLNCSLSELNPGHKKKTVKVKKVKNLWYEVALIL